MKGCYVAYLKNHDKRTVQRVKNEAGFCNCGCGLITPLAQTSRRGQQAGEHRLYFDPGHAQRLDWAEDALTGCWLLIGATARKDGYTRIRRERKLYLGHTWFWEQEFGLFPRGMHLDHLCRNRMCVNPDHLELVTPAENTRRIHERGEVPEWTNDFKLVSVPDTGCLLFPILQPDGYGRVLFHGVIRTAHRVYYEMIHGRVAKDLFLDHLCNVRGCVNPNHLEPVSRKENMRRARERHLSPVSQRTDFKGLTGQHGL